MLALVALSVTVARDAPAHARPRAPSAAEIELLAPSPRGGRVASWARTLVPVELSSVTTKARASVRLYGPDGEVDEQARESFDRIASRDTDTERHPLASRLEQLVVKAAYHFGAGRVLVVSGWRERAGKHGTGEAIDFKLDGVHAGAVAAYLRGLPRVGVGLYTHPGTQFVHLDVRVPSYHWVDASPPGVHGKERQLGDRQAERRDAEYAPDMDLPLEKPGDFRR
jgi:uncharacterized protein YcbK (DUF882 family)